MKKLFVTGTDTAVGKTYTILGILNTAAGLGYKTVAMKPFETGCRIRNKMLVPHDAALIKKAIGIGDLDAINPYRFVAPVAPYVAAKIEKKRIKLNVVFDTYKHLIKGHHLIVVEGAGGLLVPITRDFFYADLAKTLSLPILVVAANKLGVINHTLLTVSYIMENKLKLTGVVLNDIDQKNDPAKKTNPKILKELLGNKFIGEIRFGRFEKNVDLFKKILNLL
ncbi:MAG: dethiobiotin synthase [Deltaproteobacteria bacterium]|nr:dethiobiotin synthase [Deltaproteobacteria bacterium]MCL5793122.1 dethiobiotin synthase [Deltaproteobacteria bacterium]